MSKLTRNIIKEEFDDTTIEAGPGEADVDSSLLNEICEGLSNDHEELSQVLDEAKVFQDVSSQFPEGTVLTVSEEKILTAMVNLVGAGSGGTISAENLKVFKRETAGTQLSMEALEGGVWAAVKRIIAAIVARIKQFWEWLTGKGEKQIEEKQKKTEAGLKSEEGKKRMEEMSPEKLKMRSDQVKDTVASHYRMAHESFNELSKENLEYEKPSSSNIHLISGSQLMRFTDRAPSGSIVFADDIVAEMKETIEFSKKLFVVLGENELGKNIGNHKDDEAMISRIAEIMDKNVHALGLQGGKEVQVVGTIGLKYDEQNLHLALTTISSHIEHDKNYVIGIRSGSELVRKYADYIQAFKSCAFDTNLKECADRLEAAGTEMLKAGVGDMDDNKFSHHTKMAMMHHVKFIGTILMASSHTLRTVAVLERCFFTWVPKG
jgi:hypothetical protein